jgi:hypothetical protein
MCFVFIPYRSLCLVAVLSCKFYLFWFSFLTAIFPLFFNVLFKRGIKHEPKNLHKYNLAAEIPAVNIKATCRYININ